MGAASETELNQMMNFAGHNMRRLDMAWAVLFDLIHHRGQFSVYVRMAGGKGTEPIVELSFKEDDGAKTEADRVKLGRFLKDKDCLLNEDVLKTELILQRY